MGSVGYGGDLIGGLDDSLGVGLDVRHDVGLDVGHDGYLDVGLSVSHNGGLNH